MSFDIDSYEYVEHTPTRIETMWCSMEAATRASARSGSGSPRLCVIPVRQGSWTAVVAGPLLSILAVRLDPGLKSYGVVEGKAAS